LQEFYKEDQVLFIDQNVFIEWINSQWNIDFHHLCEDVDIQGSPERTIARAVIQDTSGNRFLIESFNREKYQLRLNVAKAVFYLNENGLKKALAYKKSKDGSFLPFYKNHCYQVSDFLDSTGVKQPDYLESPIMGESFSQFLIQLEHSSINITDDLSFEPFSIKAYIYQLFKQMKIHDTRVYDAFSPVLEFLEKQFMDIHDQLPLSYCHGDLHPLNVIWDGDHIKAVIDWEFTGIKPDIYDVANLVGCAGIENPNGLGMPMVMSFIHQIQEHSLYSDNGWQFLPEYMLALRFAWLSEWLRKKDQEMIEMESAYMNILMKNTDILRLGWKI